MKIFIACLFVAASIGRLITSDFFAIPRLAFEDESLIKGSVSYETRNPNLAKENSM